MANYNGLRHKEKSGTMRLICDGDVIDFYKFTNIRRRQQTMCKWNDKIKHIKHKHIYEFSILLDDVSQ